MEGSHRWTKEPLPTRTPKACCRPPSFPQTQNDAFKKEVQKHRRRPTKRLWIFTREQGREEGRKMDLKVAFGKGSGARSAADDVAAAAGQEVTPIQGSPPHHHDTVHRIRPDRV